MYVSLFNVHCGDCHAMNTVKSPHVAKAKNNINDNENSVKYITTFIKCTHKTQLKVKYTVHK